MIINKNISFQYETEHVSCNLCGSNAAHILFSGLSFDRRWYKHMKCKNCGLIYADPMPILTTQLLDQIAMELWNNDFLEGKNDFDWNHFRRYRGHNRLRVQELQNYREQGRLLDVGCSNGYFLAVARQKGWQVYGVEVCKELVRHINKYLNLNISIGTLEETKFSSDFFDVVYLNHLLEHLRDPMAFLVEVHKLLKDDGLLFIGVPNANDSLNSLNRILSWLKLRRVWTGDLCPPMHLYAFTPHTLTKMLEKAGFRILSLFTIIQGDRRYFPDYSKWSLKKLVKRIVAFPGQFIGRGAHIEVYAVKQ